MKAEFAMFWGHKTRRHGSLGGSAFISMMERADYKPASRDFGEIRRLHIQKKEAKAPAPADIITISQSSIHL
jgi:hypothetical protein